VPLHTRDVCSDVDYNEYGSMESQHVIDDGNIRGQGLFDIVTVIVELASSIATYAARVSAEAIPPIPTITFSLDLLICLSRLDEFLPTVLISSRLFSIVLSSKVTFFRSA
jgi:hypothetical protein